MTESPITVNEFLQCPHCQGRVLVFPPHLPECTKCGWYEGRWGLRLKPKETGSGVALDDDD